MRAFLVLAAFLAVPFLSTSAQSAGPAVHYRLGPHRVEAIDTIGRDEVVRARLPLAEPLYDLVWRDRWLYVARGPAGITVIDIANPSQPVEEFSFGSGPEVIQLAIRGQALVVTYADGRATAYDISRPGALRQLPKDLSWSLTATPPGGRLGSPEASARKLAIVGRVLLGVGVAFGALGGLLFYEADVTNRTALARSSILDAACRARGDFVCLNGLSAAFASLPETLSACWFAGTGIAQIGASIPILAVGEYRLRHLTLQPGLAPLPATAISPRPGPAATPGLRLAFEL